MLQQPRFICLSPICHGLQVVAEHQFVSYVLVPGAHSLAYDALSELELETLMRSPVIQQVLSEFEQV